MISSCFFSLFYQFAWVNKEKKSTESVKDFATPAADTCLHLSYLRSFSKPKQTITFLLADFFLVVSLGFQFFPLICDIMRC